MVLQNLQCRNCFISQIDYPFVPGRANEGSEEFLGEKSTAQECAIFVQNYHPSANGATWQAMDTRFGGKGNCYAKFGITSVDSNPTYQTCFFAIKGGKCSNRNWLIQCYKP